MPTEIARQRYLQRHIQPDLPDSPRSLQPWQNVLVIPAYRESPALLQHLASLPDAAGPTLIILVLNRPDTDHDPEANSALRAALASIAAREPLTNAALWHRLNDNTDLYLHDLDRLAGPLPHKQGVGLARKTGCDIAFKWMNQGAIVGRWICSTDADARLPDDYFQRLANLPTAAAAAVYPFAHVSGGDPLCDAATALYELRLHQYVLGLQHAGSPYAYHTLGSCLAVDMDNYAKVHGFPKRAGAEDFYLLGKLVKTGPIIRLAGACIELESRASHRVPFGTGPAVAKICAASDPAALPLFYHPACFAALRALLTAAPDLYQGQLPDLLDALKVAPAQCDLICNTLDAMGIAHALEHCRNQGKSRDQFLRQFHQWFDAFRTLRFIHALRDGSWPACSLAALRDVQPMLWPSSHTDDPDKLRSDIRQHLGWNLTPRTEY